MTTTRPARVALVTPRFPPDVGGLEGYVGRVAATLQESGRYDVTVVTTGASRRTTREVWRGVPVIRLGTWLTVSNTRLNPLWWRQLRRLLDRLDVDVVNAHAPTPGLADLAAFTAPVPVVLTYHAGSLVKGGHPVDVLLRAYERHVLPRVFAGSAELVAVSPTARAHATGRAHLVPPGVDTSVFTPPETSLREPRVLYVGRVERSSRWKGLPVLLEAMASLRDRAPGVRLGVVGAGDDVASLQRLAERLGVGAVVDWYGAAEHRDLPAFYRRAAVTVLPSTTESESFGMTLVEAMACGCAVVGTRVGGIPFVVREGVDGLLAEPGDAGSLAQALAAVLTDPARAAALGAAGRQAAEERWDWRHLEERTMRVLDLAMGRQATDRRTVSA
ncbi:MAG: glycosyltransferase family 4 protein [Nocardioidaceae bacterium]